MKYYSEYQESKSVKYILECIHKESLTPISIMEVCGGQTHTIISQGLDTLLPKTISLIHGPGCPVCVTSIEMIDRALALAKLPNVILCSYGDMLRVPGTKEDLLSVKAAGGDVRMVYSSLDAVSIAQANPDKKIVFFAIGFETTAPANAMAVMVAAKEELTNFYLLTSHVLVPPALEAILVSDDCVVQGFLAPGHVCTVMGYEEYEKVSLKYNVPIVVTGFEPVDLLRGIYRLVVMLNNKDNSVKNEYSRLVKREGNPTARTLLGSVFDICDQKWRGIGEIPRSGFKLNSKYRRFDASIALGVETIKSQESPDCEAGLILKGLKKPINCPMFGNICTPNHPLGAPMVSAEGACAAYYHAGRK